jgi:hypothetical protein
VIANEALPDSAETGIEHVRPVVVGLHRVDVDEMFEKVALPPLIAIPTDTADAETNWVRRLVDVVARLGMVSSAWPLVSTAAAAGGRRRSDPEQRDGKTPVNAGPRRPCKTVHFGCAPFGGVAMTRSRPVIVTAPDWEGDGCGAAVGVGVGVGVGCCEPVGLGLGDG